MKTRPCLTERLLMGRKVSNQTNKQNIVYVMYLTPLTIITYSFPVHTVNSFLTLTKLNLDIYLYIYIFGKQSGSGSAGF